jgi:hypothetical protein
VGGGGPCLACWQPVAMASWKDAVHTGYHCAQLCLDPPRVSRQFPCQHIVSPLYPSYQPTPRPNTTTLPSSAGALSGKGVLSCGPPPPPPGSKLYQSLPHHVG